MNLFFTFCKVVSCSVEHFLQVLDFFALVGDAFRGQYLEACVDKALVVLVLVLRVTEQNQEHAVKCLPSLKRICNQSKQ